MAGEVMELGCECNDDFHCRILEFAHDCPASAILLSSAAALLIMRG